MVGGQRAIAGHPRVLHRPVKTRPDTQHARPVLGDNCCLQPGQVRLFHVHKPPLGQPREPSLGITEAEPSSQESLPQVQLLSQAEHLHLRQVEPFSVVDRDGDG